jgi:hypothetical protein
VNNPFNKLTWDNSYSKKKEKEKGKGENLNPTSYHTQKLTHHSLNVRANVIKTYRVNHGRRIL